MMFTTPLPVDKINVFGIRFIKNGIIDNKKSSIRNDKIIDFFP